MNFIKYMKILFSTIYEIIRQIIYYPRMVLDDIDYDMYWKAKKKNLGIEYLIIGKSREESG